MLVARWNIDVRFGHKEEFLRIFKKWQAEVADKIGWNGKVRMLNAAVGSQESRFEYEVTLESLSDLEKGWASFGQHPYHSQFGKDLEPLIVSGTNHWSVMRVVDL